MNSSLKAKVPEGPIHSGFQTMGTILRSAGKFLNSVRLFTGEGTDACVKMAATKVAGTQSKKRKIQVGLDTPNLEPNVKHCKKPFNVCFCGVTLQSPGDLGTHLTSQHPNSSNWKCSNSTCSKVVTTSTNMWKHYRSQHLDLWLYKCSECNMPGSKSDEMSVVMKHKADKHGAPEAGIACPKCKKLYSTNTAMKKHYIGCGNKDKPFKCVDELGEDEGCGKKFREKGALQHHIKSSHGEHPRLHQCPHCDRTYEYAQGLQYHIKNNPHLHTHRSNPVAAVAEKASTIVREMSGNAAAVEKELSEVEEEIGDITSTPEPIATSSQMEDAHDSATAVTLLEGDRDSDDTLSNEEQPNIGESSTEKEVTFKRK